MRRLTVATQPPADRTAGLVSGSGSGSALCLVLRQAREVDGHGLALLGDALRAQGLLDRDLEVMAVGGRRRSDLELDDVVDDELDEVLREALHLVVGAVLDRLGEAVRSSPARGSGRRCGRC